MGAVNRDLEGRTSNKAEEIAQQRYGREFGDLPASLQMQTWMEAENEMKNQLASERDFIYDGMRENRRNGTGETLWDRLELDRRLGK